MEALVDSRNCEKYYEERSPLNQDFNSSTATNMQVILRSIHKNKIGKLTILNILLQSSELASLT